jgi:hypothetical protein
MPDVLSPARRVSSPAPIEQAANAQHCKDAVQATTPPLQAGTHSWTVSSREYRQPCLVSLGVHSLQLILIEVDEFRTDFADRA